MVNGEWLITSLTLLLTIRHSLLTAYLKEFTKYSQWQF